MPKTTVEKVFKEWIIFMNERGPMAKGGLNSIKFRELREKMAAELKQTFDDDDSFFMGGGMS